jgi:hypothetical protein
MFRYWTIGRTVAAIGVTRHVRGNRLRARVGPTIVIAASAGPFVTHKRKGDRMFSGRTWIKTIATSSLALGALLLAGCASDRPHEYGQERPPINDVDARDGGLQSKDVNEAADQVAMDLLSSPQLNGSRTQWTMVVDRMDDQTRDRLHLTDMDIFLQALKARIAQHGQGRVQLITNRQKFYDIRSREREGGGRDEFGQTGGPVVPGAPEAVQPDFALTGVARDMPRRGTNYYQIEFSVEDLIHRTTVFDHLYQVKVAR